MPLMAGGSFQLINWGYPEGVQGGCSMWGSVMGTDR